MEKLGQWAIVGIIALVAIILVIILIIMTRRKKKESIYSCGSSERHSVEVPIPQPAVKVETPKVEVKTEQPPSAPVLRCYDYFEFPQEGGFQVKTCSAPQREGYSIPSNAPKRIFLQWFPVENSQEYRIYANAGNNVSSSQFAKKWTVNGGSHYFESEELVDPVCWSVIVTAVGKNGLESSASTIYSTCTAK